MKGYTRQIFSLAAIAVSFTAGGFAADAKSLEGRWDATLTTKTGVVPFRLDIPATAQLSRAPFITAGIPLKPPPALSLRMALLY